MVKYLVKNFKELVKSWVYLKSEVDDLIIGKDITIVESTGTGDIAKVYTLKQGETSISPTINIPKDLVVSSGSIVTVEGIKYLRLVLNSGGTVDIPVSDLCDVYTADEITLELGNDNKFKVKDNVFASKSSMDNILNGTNLDSFADVESSLNGKVGPIHPHTMDDISDLPAKVTSISSVSSDSQYATAKAVYEYVQSLDASEEKY